MSSSSYVPPSGGDNQDPSWTDLPEDGPPAATPYREFDEPATQWEPAGTTAAGTDIYAPSSAGAEGSGSTSDEAKNQAADLKDTAVDKGQQVAGVAKEQAGAVKDTAVESGQHVAAVAKDEVAKVTSEASDQVKDLLNQSRDELSSQAGVQTQRLGSIVRGFADELDGMASGKGSSGPITDLAQQGSRRVSEIAHRLEDGTPGDLLDDVRNFARRRPAAFLGLAALTGVVVGRLTRNLAAEAKDAKEAEQTPAPVTTGYSTTPAVTSYDTAPVTTGYAAPGAYEPTAVYDDTVTYVEPGRGDTPR